MESIENILKTKIIKEFKSIKAFAKDIDVKYTTLDNILKKGIKTGNCFTIYKMCECLNIDFYSLMNKEIKEYIPSSFILTLKEKSLLEDYRSLDDFGVRAVDETVKVEKDRNEYYDNKINYIYKPYLEQQAAAGVGVDFESTDYELVKIVRDRLSETCDFVMKVNGESMEPDFSDGSYVMVRQFQPVNLGEIGIFLYQGEIFIKEMGKQSLLSKNSQFEPILVEDLDRFTLLGKVIGIAEVKE